MNARTLKATFLVAAMLVAGLQVAPLAAASGKVNINTATADQLALLPRVGPVVAQRILDYREKNERFKSTEELMLVQGIGEKTYAQLEPYVAIDGETTLSEKVSTSTSDDD